MEYVKIHELKVLPKYYEAIIAGEKTFEMRLNDRDYKKGDLLLLKEWSNDEGYTGRKTIKSIGYIFYGGQYGIEETYCVFGLKKAIFVLGVDEAYRTEEGHISDL